MFTSRHPEDHYTLRHHRARSISLTNPELVEVRAAQRTFEGAYIRTSLSQFSFSLVVLKIFTSEFYSIGALFAIYGAAVLMVGAWRRREGNRQFFTEVDTGIGTGSKRHGHGHGSRSGYRDEDVGGNEGGTDGMNESGRGRMAAGTATATEGRKMFKTSGNVVVMLTALSVAAYVSLLVLTLRLDG